MYKPIFVKSWSDLKNNLILLLPDILFGIFVTILGGVLFYFSGLIPIIDTIFQNINLLNQGNINDKEQILIILINLISLNFKRLLVVFASFMLTNFFVGAGFMCMKFDMMKKIVGNKKIRLKEIYRGSKKFYWKYVILKIYIRLFFIIPFLIFILITTPILFKNVVIGGVVASILFLIYLVYSVFLVFAFYFTTPILFIKDLKPFNVIKESYNFLKLKKKYVVTIWFIVLIVFVISILLRGSLNGIFGSILLLGILIEILTTIINFVISVWKDMFKFRAYK